MHCDAYLTPFVHILTPFAGSAIAGQLTSEAGIEHVTQVMGSCKEYPVNMFPFS